MEPSVKAKTAAAFELMAGDRYDQLVQEFLGKKRIVIWGVEDAKSDPGQSVARKLRNQGIHLIAVNPKFSDDPSQRRASSLTKIEPPVEAVDDCIAAKIPMVWLHNALSPGAAIPAAIDNHRGGTHTEELNLRSQRLTFTAI